MDESSEKKAPETAGNDPHQDTSSEQKSPFFAVKGNLIHSRRNKRVTRVR